MKDLGFFVSPKACLFPIGSSLLVISLLWKFVGYTNVVLLATGITFFAFVYFTYAGFASTKNVRAKQAIYLFTRDDKNLSSIHTIWLHKGSTGASILPEVMQVISDASHDLASVGVTSVDIKSPMFIGPNLGDLRREAHQRFGAAAVSTAPNHLDSVKLTVASLWSWGASRKPTRRRLKIKRRAPGVRIRIC